MFCPNCGNQVAEGQSFCANCGTKMQAPAAPAQPVQPVQQPQQPVQPTYAQPVQQPIQPTYAQSVYQPAPQQLQPQQPMKWYKFLIYFMLFLSAVLNAATAIMIFTGNQYFDENGNNLTQLVYEVFDGLQAVDMALAVGCIILAVLAIYARMRLAGFYANGPKMITVLYVCAMILNLAYTIGVVVCLGDAVEGSDEVIDYSSTAVQIVMSAIMIGVNKSYFNKRKELFVK